MVEIGKERKGQGALFDGVNANAAVVELRFLAEDAAERVGFFVDEIDPQLVGQFRIEPFAAVGLGAVLNLALPSVERGVPEDAAVIASEPVLVEAFARRRDWLQGDSLSVGAEPIGGWWKVRFVSSGERKPLPVSELGEPLVRLIVDTHLDGWLDAGRGDGADVYLPAYRPR